MNKIRPLVVAVFVILAALLAYGLFTQPRPQGAEAEGFSSAAYSGDLKPETKMNQYAASRASNNGTITLSQTSTGGELYALSGLSGGITINQKNGQITLNAKSNASVYGLYAENEGYGSENNGKIT